MQRVYSNGSTWWIWVILVFAGLVRFLFLGSLPSSLFLDEVSQGYNAYALLRTGRDEFGTFFPMTLRAFGEWKPPLQTFLMIPSIAVFGLNAWGVRFISALLGTLTVGGIYCLVKELDSCFSQQKKGTSEFVALTAAALLAISPWHIVQSRSALHGAITMFLFVWGVWALFKTVRSPSYSIVAVTCFSLMLYAYFGMQVSIFLLVGMVLFVLGPQLEWKKYFPIYSIAVGVGVLLCLPLIITTYHEPDAMIGRAKYISIFYDQGSALTIWEMITRDGPDIPSKLAQFFHNKPHQYGIEFVRRFFHHVDLRFLFLAGPDGPPFKIPHMGILYAIDGIFLISGTIWIAKKKTALGRFLLVWIAIAIVPAALTFITPSANRIFSMVIPVTILTACGVVALVGRFPLLRLPVIMGYLFSAIFFLYQYAIVMPHNHADWWNGGYRELISYLASQQDQYETITISGQAAGPYIFLLFYTQADPRTAQHSLKRDLTRDEFGFEHVAAFGKYEFPRHFSWNTHRDTLRPGSLLAVTAGEKVGASAREVHQILLPDGRIAFRVYVVD